MYKVSIIESKATFCFYNVLICYRVMLFREQPKLIYTGLTEEIGKPREFEKNLEDESYFQKCFDIKIPIYETTELRG